MPKTEAAIANPWGMHARLAFHFARACEQYRCSVALGFEGRRADGKDVMDILMLAAGPGSVVTLETEGEDAPRALEELRRFLLVDAQLL